MRGPAAPVAPAATGGAKPRSRAREERGVLVRALDDATAWPAAAAALLARLGFLLVEPDPVAGDQHLLVALRDRPSMTHFDPEALAYFEMAGDRAAPRRLDRRSIASGAGTTDRAVLWGHVHVIDRLPVENRFLTFGGVLRTAVIDPTLTILDLTSPAPIVRWGGHSQSTDALTGAIGAFFARLIVPIDCVPGAESRIDAIAPEVLYLAFLLDSRSRANRAGRRGVEPTLLASWVDGEFRRVRADAHARLAAEALLAEIRGVSSG